MGVKIHIALVATLFFGLAFSNPPFYGNIGRGCGGPEEGSTKVLNHKGHGIQGGFEAGLSGGSYRALPLTIGSEAGYADGKGRAVGIGSSVGDGSGGAFEDESVGASGTEFKSSEKHEIGKTAESGKLRQLSDSAERGVANEFGIEERFGGGTADFPAGQSEGAKEAGLLSESEIENIKEVFGGEPNVEIASQDGGLESGYGEVGGFKGLGLVPNKQLSVGYGQGIGGQVGGFGGDQDKGFGREQGFGSGQSPWFRGGEGYGFGGGYGEGNKHVKSIGIGREQGFGAAQCGEFGIPQQQRFTNAHGLDFAKGHGSSFEAGHREGERTGTSKGIYAGIDKGEEIAGGEGIGFQDEHDEGFGTRHKFKFGQSTPFEDEEDESFRGRYEGAKFGSEEYAGPIGGRQEGGFGVVRGQGSDFGPSGFVGSGGRSFADVFTYRGKGLENSKHLDNEGRGGGVGLGITKGIGPEIGGGQGGGFGRWWRRGYGITPGQGFETAADTEFGKRTWLYK